MQNKLAVALALFAAPALAQESTTTECLTNTDGVEVCVDTYIYFKATPPVEPPIEPPIEPPVRIPAGAVLPQDFDLEAFDASVGTLRFIAPNGDDGAACTEAAPCRSLGRAYSVATNGDAIVARGGIYRDNDIYNAKKPDHQQLSRRNSRVPGLTGRDCRV
jgi:hypothetical protein